VLAHIAVLSKFYGMVTYKVGKGEMTELDLVGNVGLRDVLGEQLSRLPTSKLVEMARGDHARTVAYIRSADAAALRRVCSTGQGRSMTAGDIARLPLCAHLEQHQRQLEETLRPGWRGPSGGWQGIERARLPVGQVRYLDCQNQLGEVNSMRRPSKFLTAMALAVTALLLFSTGVLAKGGTDTGKQISALEGWQFLAPKGRQYIRAADHAMIQPMFQVQLVPGNGGHFAVKVLKTITAGNLQPPVTPFK